VCVDTTATTSQGATKNKLGFSSFLVDHQCKQYGKQAAKSQTGAECEKRKQEGKLNK
jgi:hypothetical protein